MWAFTSNHKHGLEGVFQLSISSIEIYSLHNFLCENVIIKLGFELGLRSSSKKYEIYSPQNYLCDMSHDDRSIGPILQTSSS